VVKIPTKKIKEEDNNIKPYVISRLYIHKYFYDYTTPEYIIKILEQFDEVDPETNKRHVELKIHCPLDEKIFGRLKKVIELLCRLNIIYIVDGEIKKVNTTNDRTGDRLVVNEFHIRRCGA